MQSVAAHRNLHLAGTAFRDRFRSGGHHVPHHELAEHGESTHGSRREPLTRGMCLPQSLRSSHNTLWHPHFGRTVCPQGASRNAFGRCKADQSSRFATMPGSELFRVKEVWVGPGYLAEALDRPGFFQRRVGHALNAKVDRRFGESGVHLKKGMMLTGRQHWEVVLPPATCISRKPLGCVAGGLLVG